MPDTGLSASIAAVRRFNRFYTQKIGVLHEGWVQSPFSLTEARVLYEIIQRKKSTASELARDLGLDAGYLSRILAGFEVRGLIVKQTSDTDGRQSLLFVTERGRKTFAPVETHTIEEVGAMLEGLPAPEQARVVNAMATLEGLLGTTAGKGTPYILRSPRAGDMGWVVSRHGALYGEEYGWDARLEALTAEIVAKFIRNYDPQRECCWIAERDGENIGCVFLIARTKTIAQLRLLLVEPKARRLGIGARLVDECVRFAQQAGYRKIMLWTHSVLHTARHIYEKAGFELVRKTRHREFGKKLVGETWELKL